jgi:S-(hydroxymethyl)glutathione dehydrogenase/alcohol dehydrogenase
MKAAVCHEFGSPLTIESVTVDPPQPGEVKVRVRAAAICHSDIHLIHGDWFGDLPVVPGHEAAGIVESVGDHVTTVQPGDHVVVSLLRSCGQCRPCVTGSPHMCEGEFPLDTEARLHSQSGETVYRGLRVGAFAEYAIVDESQIVPVPKSLPMELACLLACGVVTGVGSVLNTAEVRPGESVVVVGCGGVGLNAIQGAALSGAYPVIALDLLDSKLEAAKLFGATHTVLAGDGTVEDVHRITEGRGADYVFVTVGAAEPAQQALQLVANQGLVVLVGIPQFQATISLPLAYWVMGERKIAGSLMGSTCLTTDIPKLLKLYESGLLKLDELITARYSFEDINDAIRSTEKGEALRNVIVFP